METSRDRRKRSRIPLLVAIIALAGVALLAAMFLNGHKPVSPTTESVATQAAPGSNAAPNSPPAKAPTRSDALSQFTPETLPFTNEIRIMSNASLLLSERRKAAEALAQIGSEAAIAALKLAFTNGPENLRAAIAESLGKCGSPGCAKWLQELLQDPSLLVARGAVRGLAEQNSPEAASALVRLLNDPNANLDLRSEVALSLGDVNQPGIVQALSEAARSAHDEDFITTALGSLGGHDFKETEPFFKEYLQTPNLSPELRVAAVEALAQAQGDPSAFLLSLVSDKDPAVRAAAAWAMSATETTGNLGAQLLELLSNESDPDVRLRMYQALRNQEGFDLSAVLAAVQRESNPSARIAGLDLLAKLLRNQPNSPLQGYFDQTAVPELKNIALNGGNFDDRQAAVVALTRARTPAAQAALREIAAQPGVAPAK